MIGWLYRLLVGRFGCRHQWDAINQIVTPVPDYTPSPALLRQACDTETPMLIPEIDIDRVTYVLRCTLCGDMKNHEVRP